MRFYKIYDDDSVIVIKADEAREDGFGPPTFRTDGRVTAQFSTWKRWWEISEEEFTAHLVAAAGPQEVPPLEVVPQPPPDVVA